MQKKLNMVMFKLLWLHSWFFESLYIHHFCRSTDSAQFRLDCIDVNISQGDITEEDADAIVASCNLDLDLTKGKSD